MHVGVMASSTARVLVSACKQCLGGFTARTKCARNVYTNQTRTFRKSASVCGVFEPDGLNPEPIIQEYPTLNLRMRCYDFVTLEGYSRYVHGLADKLGFDTESYAVPARCKSISTYKPNSTTVEDTFNLKIYERTVQIDDVQSTQLPILLELMRMHAPEGVTITVKEPDVDEEEFRYIPDKEMRLLKSQIQDIEVAKAERRKK